MNGEPHIPWLSCISNAAPLNLKLLLPPGRNISPKKLLCDLFFLTKTLTFHQWFSIHKVGLNTLYVRKVLLSKVISLLTRHMFFINCQTLHISKTNSFLDLKRNKTATQQKLRTSWYSGKFYGWVFVQLKYSFPEELKTTKQKIIYTNVTKGLFAKRKNIKLSTLQSRKVQEMSTML